jgi:hypothetical protein
MFFYIQIHGLLQILWIQFFPNIKLISISFLKTFLHQRTIFYLIIISLISFFYKELIFGPTPYNFYYLSSVISGLEIIPVFYFFLLFFTLSSSLFPPHPQHAQQPLYVDSSTQTSLASVLIFHLQSTLARSSLLPAPAHDGPAPFFLGTT